LHTVHTSTRGRHSRSLSGVNRVSWCPKGSFCSYVRSLPPCFFQWYNMHVGGVLIKLRRVFFCPSFFSLLSSRITLPCQKWKLSSHLFFVSKLIIFLLIFIYFVLDLYLFIFYLIISFSMWFICFFISNLILVFLLSIYSFYIIFVIVLYFFNFLLKHFISISNLIIYLFIAIYFGFLPFFDWFFLINFISRYFVDWGFGFVVFFIRFAFYKIGPDLIT
jgi:hypothetical protein